MWHWRDDYFKTLRELSTAAAQEPEWANYAAFCSQYERGLRTQAFAILHTFISILERKSFQDRRRFVSWLLAATDGTPGEHMAVPYPLRMRIIEPTLVEWTAVEPQCSEPHRWLGGYEHLKCAVETDASDEIARRKLIALIIGGVDYATHELPRGYIREPHRDLTALKEASELVKGLSDEEDRQEFARDIEEQRVLILMYLKSR